MASENTTTQISKDAGIVRSKDLKQIVVPAGMKLTEAADLLMRLDKAEDKTVAVYHEFEAFPLGGAVAFRAALDEIYGFALGADTPTWFGPKPPAMIGVPVGPNQIKQVPWGRVTVPGVAGHLDTNMTVNPTPKFVLTGETKQRHAGEIDAIVAKVREKLKTESIYKGKAIRLDLSWMRNGQAFSPTGDAPKFTIPVDKVKEDDLIYPAQVRNDMQLGLFTPIEHSEVCRATGIPLKRGVLLAGDYGVGKTLCAYVTAKKAVQNGWTFIYLSNALDLEAGFRFAVLNAFDGVDTKALEIITVLTTNHLSKLSQAFLRPGRCDTLVLVTRPDADAASRLVRLYGRGLLEDGIDLARVGAALSGHLPAEIREAVERAKLAAISRMAGTGELAAGKTIAGHVREDDIMAAVSAMHAQHKLLEPKAVDTRSVAEKCADIFGRRVADAVANGSDRSSALALNMLQSIGYGANDLSDAANELSDNHDVPQSAQR